MNASSRSEFEAAIRELTRPMKNQLPRPWMTKLTDPLAAKVFIVGRNQAKGFDSSLLTHRRHVDALFNRNGESCRGVYDEMTGSSPSPTRKNIDRFRAMLEAEGVGEVLETNVVCYSTPMSKDLRLPAHRGGAVRGSEIFRAVLHFVRPRVLIAHGAGTIDDLSKVLGSSLPSARDQAGPPVAVDVSETAIFVIPSLAPPAWNKWSAWAWPHLGAVAKAVAGAL